MPALVVPLAGAFLAAGAPFTFSCSSSYGTILSKYIQIPLLSQIELSKALKVES